MNDFYKRIKEKREELGLSQEELAQKLGYKSRSTIAKIESGDNDIPRSKIDAFAEALSTTPQYLMGWADEDVLLAKSIATQLGSSNSGHYIKKFVTKDSSQEAVISALQALAFYSGREVDDLFDPNDNKIVINGIEIPFPVDSSFFRGNEVIADNIHSFISKDETDHIHKYRSIDDKGKHTVDTVLDMEYNRCKKENLTEDK